MLSMFKDNSDVKYLIVFLENFKKDEYVNSEIWKCTRCYFLIFDTLPSYEINLQG